MKTQNQVLNRNNASLFPISERIKEKHLKQAIKNAKSLRDLPLELRKKEASKPIFLIRYE